MNGLGEQMIREGIFGAHGRIIDGIHERKAGKGMVALLLQSAMWWEWKKFLATCL